MAVGQQGAGFGHQGAVLGGVVRPKPAVTLPLSARFVDEGDSITAGSSGPAYQQYALALSRGRFYQSIPMHTATAGRTALQAVGRIATVNAQNPDVVSLMIGTNDLGGSAPGATVWGYIKTCIIGYLNGSATWVVLYPILPRTNATFSWDATRETERLALNVLIANFATDPDLAKYVNNIKVVPNLDASFNSAVGVNTVDGLHPNWSGANIVGTAGAPVLSTIISSSDILSLYTDPSNILLAGNNPQLAGTGGGLGGGSGQVATSWSGGTGGSIASAYSKTTLNGATAQRWVASGTNTVAGQVVRITSVLTGITLVTGSAYEMMADISLASGAANLEAVYLSCTAFSFSYNSSQVNIMDSNGLVGVLRSLPQIITSDQVNPTVQITMKFMTGVVAGDITVGRPFIRQVTSF